MKLDEKTKELIALGASVAANCHPCVQYHLNKALEAGADTEVINEALEVGKMVRKGAGVEMDKLLFSLRETGPLAAKAVEAGCGCG